MSRRRSRQRAWVGHARRQDGNYMVMTALALVALFGFLALVIDLGFLEGQRRFMQNGADAAALAVARDLGGAVSLYPNGAWPNGVPNYFLINQGQVQTRAVDLASRNQNPGILSRTSGFTVRVEYCVAVNNSSYDYSAGCPSPNSWISNSSSTASTASVPDGTYKVRVTVTSTLSTFFGPAVGVNTTTVSGQSIAIIKGVCPQSIVSGNMLPFTAWDRQNFGVNPGQLFELWGSNPPGPAPNNWKDLIDLSPASAWCDGQPSDYDWTQTAAWAGMVPTGTTCTRVSPNYSGTDASWNRGSFLPDQRGGCYTGTSTNPNDPAVWASALFQGRVAVGVGMKVPLFPQMGDQGNNIAQALYSQNGNGNPCSGTYLFNPANGLTVDPDEPTWGVYRDVLVITYDVPTGEADYYSTQNGQPKQWSATSQGQGYQLGRVSLMRAIPFRLYRLPYGQNPNSSTLWGRVQSPIYPPSSNPPICGGPGIYGNVAGLGA